MNGDSPPVSRLAGFGEESAAEGGARALGLFVGEFGMSRGDDVHSRRIIRYDGVKRDESVDLILRASVAFEVYPHLAQIFGLVIGISDGRAIVVLWFIQIAHLPRPDDRVYFRVFGGKTLNREHVHIGKSDDEVGLLL